MQSHDNYIYKDHLNDYTLYFLKKGGNSMCPGCKEPYKETDLYEKAVDSSGHRLPLPPSKQERQMYLMKSTKSGYMRTQTGGADQFDHNRWLFETKGTYGYGNAIWPKDTGYNGGGGAGNDDDGHHEPSEFLTKP